MTSLQQPVAHFESFAEGRGWSASFRAPIEQRAAYSLDEVIPLIRLAEAATKDGCWVALALSYEAAPAFDTALKANAPAKFPLAWMAVFDKRLAADVISSDKRPFLVSEWKPQITTRRYQQSVRGIKDYIERGDTYQVNLTFPLRGQVTGDSFSCYRAIARSQGAAYSAYLDIGSHRILSFSPELFVERRGNKLITQPMKGTLARGRWLEEDTERARQLRESPKDRAENVMIVDLLRSDLGKIAEIGSVKVPELFAVESLNRVLQMTSTITALQRPDVSIVDILRALFPCGSVTGAPKARSTAIINELELESRGIYTGAIGLLSPNGDATFNVAIRTAVIGAGSGTATFGVGGAITWDSTVDGEYEESCLKARFLTHPWPDFELLETIELSDGEYTLLDRHLTRARNSASYFGFRWIESLISSGLNEAAKSHPSGRSRVRLTVGRTGNVNVEVRPLEPNRRMPVAVKFASCEIDDRDPLLYHKTTARSRYDAELDRCRPCDDVIFWNHRDEVTESTIANVVIFAEGKYWTPPRSAGLLAGTLREELISKGKLFERTITKRELTELGSFALINSVRGWMRAELPKAIESGMTEGAALRHSYDAAVSSSTVSGR
ncbi:MAG: para-aminobenzoate synthetase / 4-amino-4-deoxychorismate lyase [Gemmatimonadaceae bacterium]|jgi:para-aminobenzoate synthetase/4-amino-4-deoxychorismate lyase|nr:para-aminobenzoate synthetase / 4-amino-4-deoxychorismate lyase [Gemmatimonadaceae bacterium]